MPRINLFFPIKLCITGRLNDAQLDEVADRLVKVLVSHLTTAERVLGGTYLRSPQQARSGLVATQIYHVSRNRLTTGGYILPSYRNGGAPAVVKRRRRLSAELKPFRDEVRTARAELEKAINRAGSDLQIVVLRRTLERMEAEAETNTALPLLFPGATGPLLWHLRVLKKVQEVFLPAPLDDKTAQAIAEKTNEYAQLAGQLMSYRARSLRVILIPKKGISYLVSQNEETQAALNAVASELGKWFSKHQFDPELLIHDARWGLGEMLAERPDLIVALRVAQRKPVESEKFYEGIDRPFFVTATETVISFIPIVGNAVALYEAYTGEDLFGYDLDTVDRAILAASVLLPFVGRFIKGGRALYSAERMAALYGRDARQWSRVISAGERLASHPGGSRALREAGDMVRSGRHVAEDAVRTRNIETLLKDVLATEEATAKEATRTEAAVGALEKALHSISSKHAVLKELTLDAPAIDRVLFKGPDLSHMKGQLLEELLESRVQQMLGTQAGRARLGLENIASRLEFIPGYLIRDSAGRQLTDGVVAIREGNKLRILTIFEAKAGKAAARELRLSSTAISDLSKAERAELRAYARDVLRELQEEARVAGKAITLKIEDVEREIVLSERGGQVRRDIERLAPGADERATKIFVGGQEMQAVVSPRSTKIVGVLPRDVKAGRMTQDLTTLGYVFDVLKIDISEADLVSLITDLKKALNP